MAQKKMNWATIRDALDRDIAEGRMAPGDQLPTEPMLTARFGVGRHSVRRAVETLAKEGKISVEQGRGTFIAAAPHLTYEIGKRTRLRRNLLPQGCEVTSELIGAHTIVPSEDVCRALGLAGDARVLQSHRRTLADDLPIAFGASYHSLDRFPDFAKRRAETGSTTATYKTYGIDDYVRQNTQMQARPATADEARMLRQHPDLSVIVVRAVDADLEGVPLSYSEVIWAAGRVTFTMSGETDA